VLDSEPCIGSITTAEPCDGETVERSGDDAEEEGSCGGGGRVKVRRVKDAELPGGFPSTMTECADESTLGEVTDRLAVKPVCDPLADPVW
jgi:hypothetical protein